MDLPIMSCMDGFMLSHMYEPVEYLSQEQVRKFLPKYKPKYALDPKKPVTHGTLATPAYYMQYRKDLQDAMMDSKEVIKKVNSEFKKAFGRGYGNGLLQKIDMKGKKHAVITIGSMTGTVREVAGKEGVGIIKLKSLRPFPEEDLREACSGLESVGIMEKDISLGANGTLYDEIRAALFGVKDPPKVSSFIVGIGGRDITMDDVSSICRKIKSGKEIREWVC
jgi:pyruvate ferredoxin oxidoreductase alpha subunit